MSTITVPRALTPNTNPTEGQFDSMRTYLLNFFNSGNLDETNIANGSMAYSTLSGLVDDAPLKFTSSHGVLVYDNTNDYFKIQNTQGDIVFGVVSGTSVTTEQLVLRSSDGCLEVGDTLDFNQSVGNQDVDLLWMLSKYRKPRLEYTSGDIVTAETNYPSKSIIAMRDRICEIYDTTMSLAVTANGYVSNDTGTAVSGLADGLTRTANRWYYVYAVQVSYGTQNSGAYAILVAYDTSPETVNISTLDTHFGAGKWVYVGCIRNGYNDGTNTNVIVPFIMDEGGYVRFTNATVAGEGLGVTMASTTSSTNLEYTIVIANNAAATLPGVATRVIFGGHRGAYGFEMHYRNVDTDENNMIRSGCHHTDGISSMTANLYMEVPLLEDYKIVIVVGDSSQNQRIVVAGFLDHYV